MRPTTHWTEIVQRLLSLARWLLALALVVVVLEPIFWRGLLRVDSAKPAWVERLRKAPLPSPLSELADFSMQDIPVPSGPEAVMLADRLLAGTDLMAGFVAAPYALPFTDKARASDMMLRRAIPMATPVTYSVAFNRDDALRGDGIGPLPYASLYLADVLLQAYAGTGADRYLAGARDHILSFVRFERAQWRHVGFLWNDHAMATRAGVLVRFWSLYRQHSSYDAAAAQELLDQVRRSAELLASGRDFNVRTNHGVMQNLALMQLLLAFPEMPDADAHWRVARERLESQVAFLYAEDGFVLEHSAHYHEIGVHLLGMGIRLLELKGDTVPVTWPSRLASASARLAEITRPDGTRPAYGDTELELWPAGMAAPAAGAPSPASLAVYPLSGYALWRFEEPLISQSALTWSYFSGHGHKLADEPSLLTWGAGRGWITNTGYWGYGLWGRTQAESWRGGNAPHWLGESTSSKRETRLLHSAHGRQAIYLNLQRQNAEGPWLRREVISLSSGIWLVVDHAQAGVLNQVETIWTFMPDLRLRQTAPDRFVLQDDGGAALSVRFASTQAMDISRHHGDRSPFAGWTTMGRVGLPADALRLQVPSGGSTASLFSLDPAYIDGFSFARGAGTDWSAQGSTWSVTKNGNNLRIQTLNGVETLQPKAMNDIHRPARAKISAALADAKAKYPRELQLDPYRERMAKLLLGGLLAQEFALLLMRRRWAWAGGSAMSLGLVLVWMVLALWLTQRYFHAQ